MWQAIKELPGTVVILIATLLGIVVLSIMFPERVQLIATLGVICLVPIVTYRINMVAGHIVTVLVVVALAFWLPSVILEAKRANDPNGTFASFFAKAKEQTMNASRTYAAGATSQASIMAGVMSTDAKLSGNLDVHILRMGQTIDTSQLVLNDSQINILMSAAGTIPENQSVFKRVLTAAGIPSAEPTKAADSLDTLVVNVANEDGTTFPIPRGMSAQIHIDSAWYGCNFRELLGYKASYTDGNGYGIVPYTANGGGREYVNRFLNPNEVMGAVLVFDQDNPKGYRLAMGQTIVVNGGTVKIAVNDWQGGIFGGKGGSFAVSPIITDGGFPDNQGFLRLLVVLKPLA